jgi:UDP-2,3-diacylglucosamine hydrolase
MRSRLNGWLYSLLHPDIGIGLAQAVARGSRVSSAKPSLVEDMAAFAKGRLESGFNIVIMGHSHVPELRRFNGGVYINLGSWVTDFTYGVIRDGVPSLEVFEDA